MNRAAFAFLLTTAVATVWAALAPGRAIQPGRLLAAHAALQDDCFACHALGRGVESARCEVCHARPSMGRTRVGGIPRPDPRPELASLHAEVGDLDCAECHAEHAGRLGGAPAARFRHERLARALREDCRRCHAARRPADELHGSAGDACASCHSTEAWKPATYDHERFFRFDRDHPPRCADCHEPGRGFGSYSCAGCHPWSRIAEEHEEEGVREGQGCVECHRSGDKHAAEGRERRGGREHEEREEH